MMADENRNVPSYKIVILGAAGVGKSTMAYKFIHGEAPQRASSTVGMDYFEKILNIEGTNMKIIIWDTAGLEKSGVVQPNIYREANAVILIYDITRRDTFNSLNFWMKECTNHGVKLKDIPVLLIANKYDLKDKAKVSEEEGKSYATEHNMMFFKASVHTDVDVCPIDEVFFYVARILKFTRPAVSAKKDTVQLGQNGGRNQQCCQPLN